MEYIMSRHILYNSIYNLFSKKSKFLLIMHTGKIHITRATTFCIQCIHAFTNHKTSTFPIHKFTELKYNPRHSKSNNVYYG